jgi:two-component system response regulator
MSYSRTGDQIHHGASPSTVNSPRINILIVEDNLGHQKITEYGLRRSNAPLKISVVRDGQEVLDYLFRAEGFEDAERFPAPDLILLDLNLPKRDGREILKIIKEDARLREIPVVIVSTSDREEDIAYAFETGAVGYISKSSGFDKYNEQLANVHTLARVRPQP